MDKHRNNYNCWKLNDKGSHTRSYDLFDKYGLENCKIYLIENFPCQTINELHAREGHYIKTLKCVNKLVAGRTMKEYKQVYYVENKSQIAEKHKEYYNNNLEQSKAHMKNMQKLIKKKLMNTKSNIKLKT